MITIAILLKRSFIDFPLKSSNLAHKDLQFSVFSFLWAIATLFHMAHSNLFTTSFHYVLLTLSALYVVVNPSLIGFLMLISLQLVDVIYGMPNTSNHWFFTAFANITIIQALLYLIIRNKTININKGQLFDTFSPVLRIELIILYFFAVFHKLNTGFFTPDSSCATTLLKDQQIGSFIPLPPEIFAANAYFTLIIESFIPISFCFRRTRNWGILIGLLFHGMLAYNAHNAYYDFSSMAFALYFLFIAPTFSSMLVEAGKRIQSLGLRVIAQKYLFTKLTFLTVFWLMGMAVILLLTKILPDIYAVYLHIFWTAYSLLYIFLFVRFMLAEKRELQTNTVFPLFTLSHKSFLILPVIVFLNGLSPYIGLKTENSFAMFSNLRTEGNRSNHFIVPASMQLFDYQKDLVEIVASSDHTLQRLAEENKLMVYFAFKNYVAKVKPEKVAYIRKGKTHVFVLNQSASSHELLQKNHILRKLLSFRTISKEDPQPCSH